MHVGFLLLYVISLTCSLDSIAVAVCRTALGKTAVLSLGRLLTAAVSSFYPGWTATIDDSQNQEVNSWDALVEVVAGGVLVVYFVYRNISCS